jgi:protein SCO1/2
MAQTSAKPGGSSRFLLIAVTFAAILVIGAGLLLGLAFRDNPRGAAGTVLASAIGGPFKLVDQDGKTVTDADLKGKWQLVFFGYTHCPDTCPTALNELALALDQLGPKKQSVGIVFITVDPERDTPAVMKDYVGAFEDANIVGLTGTPEQVSAAQAAYRVNARRHDGKDGDYTMSHASTICVMDPDGRFVARVPPENIAERLAQLVR